MAQSDAGSRYAHLSRRDRWCFGSSAPLERDGTVLRARQIDRHDLFRITRQGPADVHAYRVKKRK